MVYWNLIQYGAWSTRTRSGSQTRFELKGKVLAGQQSYIPLRLFHDDILAGRATELTTVGARLTGMCWGLCSRQVNELEEQANYRVILVVGVSPGQGLRIPLLGCQNIAVVMYNEVLSDSPCCVR